MTEKPVNVIITFSKIKFLGHIHLSEEDQKKFEEIMPHLCNEAVEGYGFIAMPYHNFYPAENVWEVDAKLRTYDGVGIWDDLLDLFAKNPKRKKTT